MRVAHIITRLILGGAQENTVLNCEDLLRDYGDQVLLITGPPLGPEGSLLQRARAAAIPLVVLPSLRRAIHPWHDWLSLRGSAARFAISTPTWCIPIAARRDCSAAWRPARAGCRPLSTRCTARRFIRIKAPLARALFRNCERFAARRCDRLISVADAMTEQLVRAGVAPREKFITVHSGMEVDQFLRR